MAPTPRFQCPACGFAIFNRRLAACESCKAPLPAELLFSGTDLARMAQESARIEKIRQDMAREAERQEEERRRRQGDGG